MNTFSLLKSSNANDFFKRNDEISFHIFRNKYNHDFKVTTNYLNNNHQYLIIDFKIYSSNLLVNDGFVDRHLKYHRDYEVSFLKIIIKIKNLVKNKK